MTTVLFYALNTELKYTFASKAFCLKYHFKPISVEKIIEFCLFGDTIFDVTLTLFVQRVLLAMP